MKCSNDDEEPLPENVEIKQQDKPRQLGMFILAYSRRIMNAYYKIFNDLNILVYYTDTDSMYIHNNDFIKSKITLPKNKTLGLFSDDLDGGKIIKMICVAPKLYAYLYINEAGEIKTNFKTKGCGKGTVNLDGFIKMACGEDLEVIRPFQLKRSVENGNVLYQANTKKFLNKELTKNRLYVGDKSTPYGYTF